MLPRLAWLLTVILFLPVSGQLCAQQAVWKSGETAKYLVTWGVVLGAEVNFGASEVGDNWVYSIDIRSRGVVDTFYPISSWAYSIQSKSPWRSTHFGVNRFENGKPRIQHAVIHYDRDTGNYYDLIRDKNDREFSLKGNKAIYDMLSSAYYIRTIDWEKNPSQEFLIYERYKLIKITGKFEKREKRQLGDMPAQDYLLLHLKEVRIEEEEAKEPNKKKSAPADMELWVTADEKKLPVMARAKLKFGTIAMTLTEYHEGGPAGPK